MSRRIRAVPWRLNRSWIPACLAVAIAFGGLPAASETPGTVASPAREPGVAGWPTWGGSPKGTRFSPLDEIDSENVHALELAWSVRTGDFDPSGRVRTSFQATPVLVGDTLVLCTPFNRVLGLAAETGEMRWSFDPKVSREGKTGRTCRGVAVWRSGGEAPACATRVFTGTVDARLIVLDAETGRPCADFGQHGEVDLEFGLGPTRAWEVQITSPPTVVGDVVAVGSSIADSRRVDAPGGVIRGYDVRTGALRWAFDTAPPQAGPTARDGGALYHRGTPNAWSVFSVDPERGFLFVPTGNPSNDFFRGNRGGIDHYGSSLLALDGKTGRLVWHFQTVHHDLWDYDVGSQPSVITLRQGERNRQAVMQPTKLGHIFLLDPDSGAPLFPVEERAVAGSDVPGEITSPTQPFPTHPPPLHPSGLSPEDVWGLTPIDRWACRKQLSRLRNEGPFTPPSLQGSIQYPSVAGGANWGSAAFEPKSQLLVLTQTRLANVQRLVPASELPTTRSKPPREILFPQQGSPYGLLQGIFLSPLGVPCTPPPWATLTAVDLSSGETRWEVPFGTTRNHAPWPFWLPWGIPGMGGPIVTAGGLVFIGAAMDGGFRAYALESGEELWRTWLPAGGQATPLTYRVRPDGRQFVVIAAGGHSTLGTKAGDWLLAYALPE
ncbi:MAG: pyrroloquinoline quinone-dependent dehydrogenase [Deltaproteobacteria bacterium]|nr:pyrroloquinoline quinone-dependent dehydrogenase [Deltaproteobacteria bacterium]